MPTILMLLSKSIIGDTRVNREVKSIIDAGFSVKVFSWDREKNQFYRTKSESNIDVDFIGPLCPKRSLVNFVLKLPLFWLSCMRNAKKEKISIVHAHDLDTLVIGFIISRFRNRPLIFDSHESYTDMIANDVPRAIIKVVNFVQKLLIHKSDLVVVANDRIIPRIGADGALVVLNCPSKTELDSTENSDDKHESDFPRTIGYFGTLEPHRFVLEAMEIVNQKSKWKLIIAGDGTLSKIVSDLAARSESIEYLGTVTHDQAIKGLFRCDIVHVILDPDNLNNYISTPLRMFEAIAVGRPPIVTEGTYAAEIVNKENCGLICKFDPESFSKLLDEYADSSDRLKALGENGRLAFNREYNWETQVSKMIEAYRKMLS